MRLTTEREVANTRAKLARLEGRFEALRDCINGNERVREMTMISLKRLINQFKEEIARYECGCVREDAGHGQFGARRRVLSDVELANTRRKLNRLERMYEAHDHDADGDDGHVRDVSRQSLKRMINQLKEEIIWTEVHQPARP